MTSRPAIATGAVSNLGGHRAETQTTTRRAAAGLCLAALLAALPAHGQVNTFTSGNPPVGDGNDYPTSLNPARQTSGGASAGTFFSNTVGFNNLNGNPAFFDANNLLTRPASLITGDAFWTDPKLGNFNSNGGTFSIAQVGFQFYDRFDSFGFDMAVASASANLPESLPFQIQTLNDEFAYGELRLDEFGGFAESISPVTSGSFATLGGARPGFEGRYRIDVSEIEAMLNEQRDFEEGGDEIILNDGLFFDIDLASISTLGGTTQIAFDNFVLNGASLPVQTPEPTYLPPTTPVGDNRPQYFNYAAEAAPDNPDGDEYEIDPSVFDADLTAITVVGETPAADSDARAFTNDVNIYFESSAPENGLSAHEVVHSIQHDPDNEPLPEGTEEVGPSTQLLNFVTRGGGEPAPDDSVGPQIVEISTTITDFTGNAGNAIERAAERQRDNGPSVQSVQDLADNVGDAFGNMSNAIRNAAQNQAQQDTLFAELLDLSVSEDDIQDILEPMNFAGFSVSDYLAYKDDLGEELVLGDQGFTVTPIFDTNGDLISYQTNTWTVTNQSGIFTPVIVVPEPASVVLLAGLSLACCRRRR